MSGKRAQEEETKAGQEEAKEAKDRGIRDMAVLILAAVLGILVGAVTGALDALFGRVLLAVTACRMEYGTILIPLLALAGVLSVYLYRTFGEKCARGMGLVFEVGFGTEKEIPLRLIPLVTGSTWLTHLFGGSAGREGVAVQIGAAVSHGMFGRLPFKNSSRIFLVTGMAAGFAGLFRTPLAAVLFAAEVLWAGRLEYRALVPALTASFTASTVSGALGLEKFAFPVESLNSGGLSLSTVFLLLGAGLIFGTVGGAFAWTLGRLKKGLGEAVKNPVVRIAVCSAGLSILLLLFYGGRYCGLGTNLIEGSLSGEDVKVFDWILKFFFTAVTIAAGFQGGEVTPLFSIGASLGAALSLILPLPLPLLAALGYAAVFGGATNTFLAPVFIGAEVFGCELLPCFFIVCAAARLFNGGQSIYSLQRREQWEQQEK
ncbi:chloride channel protein [Clostridium sp. M62/1]|uniref:chloride channel protein n=1 Tax=Clostridium sp. M62/1 TaxID=411486 RepID=UPI00356887ED